MRRIDTLLTEFEREARRRGFADVLKRSVMTLTSLALLVAAAAAQPSAPMPLTIEKVELTTLKMSVGLRPVVAVTVINTGERVVDAWGVTVRISLPNGETVTEGVSTDGYERGVPGLTSSAVVPRGRQTINVFVRDARAAVPGLTYAGEPTFVILDDNTAVGHEPSIAWHFRNRNGALETWAVAERRLRESDPNTPAEVVLRTLLNDLEPVTDPAVRDTMPYRELDISLRSALREGRHAAPYRDRLTIEAPIRRKLAEEHYARR